MNHWSTDLPSEQYRKRMDKAHRKYNHDTFYMQKNIKKSTKINETEHLNHFP